MQDWGVAAKRPEREPGEQDIYDLLILGAGPAGMTAGVYAARKQLRTVIISEDVGGQTSWSSGIENYLGYMYITGPELVAKFEEHLRSFDLKLDFGKITGFTTEGGLFKTILEDGRTLQGKAAVIATGKSPKMLNVPGEAQYRGRGVSYCPTCDAPLFSGVPVAVIGGGNSGFDALIQLMKICPKVYLIEFTEQLKADDVFQERVRQVENVEIFLNTSIVEIRGDQMVNCIQIENRSTGERRCLDVKGVFVEIGLCPNTGFLGDMLPLNDYGEIAVNCACETKIPGLFAAGDVTTVPQKQIIIAAGQGATAALCAYNYLVRKG